MKIDNITELADKYQAMVYPKGAHPVQLRETKMAYLAGFYESLQISKQLPKDKLALAEKELREYFDKMIAELREIYKSEGH